MDEKFKTYNLRVDSKLWGKFTNQKPRELTINDTIVQLLHSFVNNKQGLTEPKVSELETYVSDLLLRVKTLETYFHMANLDEFPDSSIGEKPENGTIEILRAKAIKKQIEGAEDMSRLQLLNALQPKQMRWKEQ